MVKVDLKTLTGPIGIVRILEFILTCITFSLVASVGTVNDSFWAWCMFSWCFCFAITFLILILELFGLNSKIPISWSDFTAAFSMLATLMVLTASIIFSVFYADLGFGEFIGASVISFLTFILYAVEVGLIRFKSEEISGFLATIPGLLKVIEAFVACIIFICLDYSFYWVHPGLQWCVAVYSICFIFAMLVIIATIGRLLTRFPAPFSKVLIVCNVLAVLMYMTAVVIWPVYSFKNNSGSSCSHLPRCPWNMLVVISFMTCLNLVAYIVDTVYSFRLQFITQT
ncbi:hypothetical protein OJAV_G00077500 [Oryzias javanicus]|uniref:MARVEL domain-containing protein n=1 Tax=Oryzias javanicus TaxID=123683 RepID=A0A437D423_ORYJA|nr:hypothetical protein OJAV_G00077500 [Oryzias javanicus]